MLREGNLRKVRPCLEATVTVGKEKKLTVFENGYFVQNRSLLGGTPKENPEWKMQKHRKVLFLCDDLEIIENM